MKKHIITLGGLPGSGKSTIKRLLEKRLGYRSFSTGDHVRELAVERGLTLEEFNNVIAKDRDIDVLIDKEQERIEREEDNMVVDAHLGFHFVPSSFKVFLKTSVEDAAGRIFNDKRAAIRIASGDTMETLEEAKERTELRIKNHEERYMKHYGIRLYDINNYDLVVETKNKTPDEIADEIVEAYNAWLAD